MAVVAGVLGVVAGTALVTLGIHFIVEAFRRRPDLPFIVSWIRSKLGSSVSNQGFWVVLGIGGVAMTIAGLVIGWWSVVAVFDQPLVTTG